MSENKTYYLEFVLKFNEFLLSEFLSDEGIEVSKDKLYNVINDFLTFVETKFERNISSKLNSVPIVSFHDDNDLVLQYNFEEDDEKVISEIKEIVNNNSFDFEVIEGFKDNFVFCCFENSNDFVNLLEVSEIEKKFKEKNIDISYELITALIDSLQVTMETNNPETVNQIEKEAA